MSDKVTPSTPRVVRLVLTDVFGIARAKTVSFEQYRRVLDEGHPWASPLLAVDLWQNLPEDDSLGSGNVTIHPDPDTFFTLPWETDTAVVLCGARRGDEQAPTPREALVRVLQSVEAAGLVPKFGPELEFTVLDPDGGAPFGMDQWFTSDAISTISPLVDDLYRFLPELDIPVYEIFNEHGMGQMEINLEPAVGVQAWDRIVLMQLALREIARRHGLRATFLSKPSNDPECAPSGFHVHQTLHRVSDDTNIFELQPDGNPTDDACHYVGGQLRHANAITAFAAPTITAYKRFRPGSWAPMRAGWGVDNRAAMVRLHVGGRNTRVENRLGSSDANPYLLAAAQVAAGMAGIADKVDPGKPASHNVADDPEYPLVPTNLHAALEALADDHVLTVALGEELCRLYISVQKLVLRRFHEHVSDWELREYRSL